MNRVTHHELCRIPWLMSSNQKSIHFISCVFMQSLGRSILVVACTALCGLQCARGDTRMHNLKRRNLFVSFVVHSIYQWSVSISALSSAVSSFHKQIHSSLRTFIVCERFAVHFRKIFLSPDEKNSNDAVVPIYNHLITILTQKLAIVNIAFASVFQSEYSVNPPSKNARWQTEKVKTSLFHEMRFTLWAERQTWQIQPFHLISSKVTESVAGTFLTTTTTSWKHFATAFAEYIFSFVADTHCRAACSCCRNKIVNREDMQ